MEFRANRKILLEHLKSMAKVVLKASTRPELSGFLIEANEDDGYLYLTATNMEASIQRKLKPEVEMGGGFVMNAKLLTDILAALGGDEVRFKELKPGQVEIRSGRCTYTMPVLDGASYPRPEMPFPDCTYKIRGLKSLYASTAATVASGDVSEALKGIHIDITENGVRAVSCSGTGVAIATVPMQTGGKLSFTLPKANLSYLAAAVGNDDELEIGRCGAYIVVMKEGMMFSSRYLAQEYVNVDALMDSVKPVYTAKTEYEEFKAAVIDICDIAAMGKEKSYIKMEFSENTVKMSTENDVGSSAVTAPCVRIEGGEHAFYYPANQLMDIFRALDGTMVIQLDKRGYLLAFTRTNKYMITPMTDIAVKRQVEKLKEIKAKGKKQKKDAKLDKAA